MCKGILIKYNKDRFGGFTLLGVLFSVSLAIMVIVAIASLFSQVYGSSRSSRDRFIAVGLAKEGIELVRNIRDGNWLYYPQPADTIPVTKMQWRGDGVTASCPVVGTSCLRNLCNSGANYYTVDALSSNLGLILNGDPILRTGTSGFYTHGSGTDTIFSRKITIDTPGVGGGNCGDTEDSDPLSQTYSNPKPNPMIVKSIVQWKKSPSDTTFQTVVLQESLYDWMLQRPQ